MKVKSIVILSRSYLIIIAEFIIFDLDLIYFSGFIVLLAVYIIIQDIVQWWIKHLR